MNRNILFILWNTVCFLFSTFFPKHCFTQVIYLTDKEICIIHFLVQLSGCISYDHISENICTIDTQLSSDFFNVPKYFVIFVLG